MLSAFFYLITVLLSFLLTYAYAERSVTISI
jgi:hypothetical protein